MWFEQAIFTSLARQGKAGYHVVARSPGVHEAEVLALATWSPSHGALIVDGSNRTSVNFHPMPGGRFALSRTCQGPAEYSGRGGRQLYTHALLLDAAKLKQARYQLFAVYRDALALGYFRYQAKPAPVLEPVRLSSLYILQEPEFWTGRAQELGLANVGAIRDALDSGRDVQLAHAGDRAAAVECLLGLLPPETILEISFTTSLRPSAVRPCRLTLVGAPDSAG